MPITSQEQKNIFYGFLGVSTLTVDSECGKHSDMSKLNQLLARRRKYFMLQYFHRMAFVEKFLEIQREIIDLKIKLEIFQDPFDFVTLKYDHNTNLKAWQDIKQAEKMKQIRILENGFEKDTKLAYCTILKIGDVQFDWIRKECELKEFEKHALIESPWVTKFEEE